MLASSLRVSESPPLDILCDFQLTECVSVNLLRPHHAKIDHRGGNRPENRREEREQERDFYTSCDSPTHRLHTAQSRGVKIMWLLQKYQGCFWKSRCGRNTHNAAEYSDVSDIVKWMVLASNLIGLATWGAGVKQVMRSELLGNSPSNILTTS